MSIVVGYDGSDSSVRALTRAAALTGYACRLAVVHVVSSRGQEAESSRLLAEAAERLMQMRVFSHDVERRGDVADELIKTVEERDADLLVVGNGKSALQRFLLGSVSTEVVHRAPCDVLVVR